PLYNIDTYGDGTNVPGFQWDYGTFAGFWYDVDDDLQTEHLTILETPPAPGSPLAYPGNREIAEGGLVYSTSPVFQEYEIHANEADPSRTTQTSMEATYDGLLDQPIGLCVESDNAGGDCGYFIEGWMAEEYIAIDGNADKLTKLLVEFEDDDKKTLATGEEWDLGGGFVLEVTGIDTAGEQATIHLSKNGGLLDTGTLDTGGSEQDRVYTYTADIGNEYDIPVFSCYVNAVSGETDTVEIMYVFLIDDDVLEIDTSDTYGSMEVMTASTDRVVLTNDEATIDVDIDTTEHIMGDLYFTTADDNVNDNIRFYPYVEYTEPGTYEVRGTIVKLDGITDTIANSVGAPLYVADVDPYKSGDQPGFQWDYSSFAGVWYDLDEDLQTETLTILANERDAPGTDTLTYPTDREIGEGNLVYTTYPVFQEYQMHQDIAPDPARLQTAMEYDYDMFFERGPGSTGLCVESDNAGGDCGYFIEGWMGEKYVAIDGNADKLCELLLEFEDDDKKTLYLGDEWNISGGFTLELIGIDDTGDKATLQLFK
ncbi:MAG: S-layer protein domain-containing protein, partial [Thermodesulfobacteriota bacterium]|nr:S-layer protein domain-containing protein [Thermodesulfobacteriota bacterium]